MRACNQYIYLTAASLECYRELGTGLALTAAISIPRNASADRSSHEESLRQFEAHLDRFLHDRYFVITDTQAEAYQAETVPTLSRKDLNLLLTRKLEQRYRTTSYRALVPHRRRVDVLTIAVHLREGAVCHSVPPFRSTTSVRARA